MKKRLSLAIAGAATLALIAAPLASAQPAEDEANRMYVCVATNGEVRVDQAENVTCSTGEGIGNVAIARSDASSNVTRSIAGVLPTDDRNLAIATATNGSRGTTASASYGDGNKASASADNSTATFAYAGDRSFPGDNNTATSTATNSNLTRTFAGDGDGNTATATADNSYDTKADAAFNGSENTATATASNSAETFAFAYNGDGNTATATAEDSDDSTTAEAGGALPPFDPLDDQEACAVNGENNINTGC